MNEISSLAPLVTDLALHCKKPAVMSLQHTDTQSTTYLHDVGLDSDDPTALTGRYSVIYSGLARPHRGLARPSGGAGATRRW